ncbi:HEAT repeat domain-containing protein [Roseateles chitinivorans]|uniref:HEAT repeat domain-containing protein n=1 Tax=Roseateles chitinivorans TaxID=2917965 RepID=UPI003D67A822
MNYNEPPPDDAELPGILAGLIAKAASVDLGTRRDVFEQLYELAYKVQEKASAAVPALIDGLLDPDTEIGENAKWALRYCAPDSIGPLVECLAHPRPFVRERAAHALGDIGEDACHAASSRLRSLLADTEDAVRQRAAWALGLMHDTSDRTVALLADMAGKESPADAGAALHALGNIGKSAGAAALSSHRSLVLAALDRPTPNVRRWALYAAEWVGLESQAWADVLVDILRRDDASEVRLEALSTLKELAPSVDLSAAVPALIARLAEPGQEASRSCEVLGEMRPRPAAAVPALREALMNDDLVRPAGQALWRIERQAEALIPAMRRVFDEDGESICDLICEIGPAASPLIPDVIKALGEENWDLQWAAADALRAMASSDPMVMPPLMQALSHPSPIVRSASARALAAIGAAAIEPLRALLNDTSAPHGVWAAYALGEMGPAAVAAMDDLRPGMRAGAEPRASCCAIAMVRIAADAEAVSSLIAMLRRGDQSAPRQAAIKALGELGPMAMAAAGVLEALVDDEDYEVADEAAQALIVIRGSPQ